MDQNGAMKELPKYKSHKEVWALKIELIEFDSDKAKKENRETDGSALLFFENYDYAPIEVDYNYIKKHNPQPGGYYVIYEDGYKSWSPAEAFEKGYSLIE